jgi:trans-aconitate 2-methyltransferase
MWNPQQYERFKLERAQPFHDLLALVEPRPAMRVVDLGCGTGELTRLMHEQLEAAKTLGVDSSAEMLARAAAFATDTLSFEQATVEAFTGRPPFDLLFSNAALHWVEDHPALFARLTTMIAPGGQLAVQMPFNHDHVSQRVAAELAPRFGVAPRVPPLLAPEAYASLLHSLGYSRQHVRLQVYGHVLDSARGVIEWVKGSTLTEYQRKLGERWPEFLEAYTERMLGELGDARPYFFPFKRVHIWGLR